MKKYTRQRKIIELIMNNKIETQEELLGCLKRLGIDITQATISRDMKELGVVKVISDDGKYKYSIIENGKEGTKDRLIKIFKSSVIDIIKVGQIIVIKTLPGAAQVCASAIDNLEIDQIVGSIAGDDTIFVAINSIDNIDEVLNNLYELLN